MSIRTHYTSDLGVKQDTNTRALTSHYTSFGKQKGFASPAGRPGGTAEQPGGTGEDTTSEREPTLHEKEYAGNNLVYLLQREAKRATLPAVLEGPGSAKGAALTRQPRTLDGLTL